MKKTVFWVLALVALCALAAAAAPESEGGAEDTAAALTANEKGGMAYEIKYIKDRKAGKYSIDLRYPLLKSEAGFAAAANKDIKESYDSFAKGFREILGEVDYGPEMEMELTAEPTVTLNRAGAFSVRSLVYSYTGGAHPNTVTYCGSFIDGVSKPLRFADLFRPDAKKDIVALLKTPLDEERRERIGDPDLPDEEKQVDPEYIEGCIDSFVLTPTGVNWIFDPYAIGSYAEGRYEALLSWTELKPYFKPNKVIAGLTADFESKVRVKGSVHLPYEYGLPAGAKLKAGIMDMKKARAAAAEDDIEACFQLFELPLDWGQVQYFDLLFDEADKKNAEGYEFAVCVVYDGAQGEFVRVQCPASGLLDSPVELNKKQVRDSSLAPDYTKEWNYLVYECKAVYVENIKLGSDPYVEVRLMDGDRILRKQFTKEYLFNPAEIAVCFDARDLENGRDYSLKVLLRNEKGTLFESEPLEFRRDDWTTLPEDIRLIRK